MEQEKTDKIIVSVQPYKEIVFEQSDNYPFFIGVSIQDYKRHLEWNEFDFKKEVFKQLLGEDFGKKDFYYSPKTWGFIIDAVENKIKEVLKTIKKVPQEHQQNPMEYLKVYKNQHFDHITNRALFHEDVREFLGEFYHYNNQKNIKDGNLYYFQMFYNNLKKIYDEEYPLYISVATVDDQMKYSLIDRL